jgi:hypothetical protein
MNGTDWPRADSSLLHAALSLATRDWHVFPCVPGGKRPALRDNWQQLATTDPARILRWWTRTPFNIGISCGPSGLAIIDLDVTNNGRDGEFPVSGVDSLAELCQQRGQPYPDGTFNVSTPSGGTHLYFEAPSEPVRNSAGRLGALIDVRAAGGYVVAPLAAGSVWSAYAIRDHARPASLPPWIADLLTDRPGPAIATQRLPAPGTRQATKYALTALREETARVAAARPGTRNDTLNRSAFSLGQLVATKLLSPAEVMAALAEAAEICGLPGDEAHRTINSGMSSGVRHPRTQKARVNSHTKGPTDGRLPT